MEDSVLTELKFLARLSVLNVVNQVQLPVPVSTPVMPHLKIQQRVHHQATGLQLPPHCHPVLHHHQRQVYLLQVNQVLHQVEDPVVPRAHLPLEDLLVVPVHPHRVAQVHPRAQDLPAAQVPHRVVDRLPAPALLPRAILAPHPVAGLPALPVLLLAVDLPAALVPLLPVVQVLLPPAARVCHQAAALPAAPVYHPRAARAESQALPQADLPLVNPPAVLLLDPADPLLLHPATVLREAPANPLAAVSTPVTPPRRVLQ